ncbi:hypothetical protein [Curtobacterium flaccumfaciens]|uniref:hypothetical protein n=1 Tax=Curtobacterium flaccumfaciens TaxID=2035 RepID=UPI00265928D5|nr:hypothetical protein [Curtobacterium flaccumfaciens]MCS5506767.1 hypothetical protein [Curtobacterium flaccumfaciens pv. flaccumfaciens]
MDPAHSLQELLWNVSMMARRGSQQTRAHVLQRDTKNRLVPAAQPEETTTNNLVRHLGFYGRNLGVRALLHTRSLEGGWTSKGTVKRKPSGADLELAIEVSPGTWFDLLLQAKAYKPRQATYDHWSPTQNNHLINWAKRDNRVPGMLLYNDLMQPFVNRAVEPMDFRCSVFGACKSIQRVQVQQWNTTKHCKGPEATPVGISMCLDQKQMLAPPVKLAAMRSSHFQLEHLLHMDEHMDPIDSGGGTLAKLSRPSPPGWAVDLLNEPSGDSSYSDVADAGGDESRRSQGTFTARTSIVIPFTTPLDDVEW